MKTKLLLFTLCLAGLISAFGQETVLMVVGNTITPNASDAALKAHLVSYGYSVQMVGDSASTAAEAAGKVLVITSSTVTSANVADKFRDVAVPVVDWEVFLEDDFLMASDMGTTAGQTDVIITDAQHPLAGGLSAGVHTVTTSPTPFTYGFPEATAKVVATLADFSDWPCIYGYDAGATLNDGVTQAPARRVLIFLTDDAFALLTPDGVKLVNGALAWAMNKPNLGTQSTISLTQPTNGTAFPANTNIVLTAAATGPVTKVEFYEGANKIGEATNSPFTFTWTNVVTGRYQLSAKLINPNLQIASTPVKISVGNVAPQVLMVVGDPTVLQSGEAALKARLESFAYYVAVVDDNLSTSNDAVGTVLVIVSGEYVDAGSMGDKFRDVPVPVVNCRAGTQPNFLMTGGASGTDYGALTSQSDLIITDAQHPMAGGLSAGVHTVTTSSLDMNFSWGVPGSTATVVATLSDGSGFPCIYGYETGALLIDGVTPAPARRVHVYLDNRNAYSAATAEGVQLVDAVLAWALHKSSLGTLPTVSLLQPANGATFNGGMNIVLSASASSTGGQVVRVEFYANTTNKIGQATSSPYTTTWTNAPTGNYRITARVIDSNGFMVDSTPANIVVGAAAPQVLLVVANASAPNASETGMKSHLESFGLVVQMISDSASTTADATGKALILVSSTVSSVNVLNKFQLVPVPVIDHEPLVEDNFLMTLDDNALRNSTSAGQTDIIITDPSHPLAAGLSAGAQTMETTAVPFAWGVPATTANVVATLADGSGSPCLYCYEKGALLIDGVTPAPARRVFSFEYDNGFAAFTPEGLKLFDAALKWVLPGLANPPTVSLTQPTNGATFPANTNILLAAAVTGSVIRVDFFEGINQIGQATSNPFTITWTNVPAGAYQLTAKATDSNGFSGVSAPVSIVVATAGGSPAISFVSAAQNIVLDTNVSLTMANNAGDTIVVAVREGSDAGTGFSSSMVTDTAGNTYTLVNIASQATRGSGVFVATNVVASANNTIKFTWTVSTTVSMVAEEFANVAGVETSTTNTSSTSVTTLSSGSLVATNKGELFIFEAETSADETTWTAGSGYTIPANGSNRRLAMQYFIADAPGTYSTSISGNASAFMDGVYVALLPALATAPTVVLGVARSNNDLVFSWLTSAQGFSLETTSSLTNPTWVTVQATVTVVNGQNTVTLPISAGSAFYRLRK